MKEIDTIGIKLCDEQAELFEKSLEIKKLSSAAFIKVFMHSSLAMKFDNLSIINDIFVSDSFIQDYKDKEYKHGGVRYSKSVLFWIGYIYRYWSYTREISSKELYKIVKPVTLAKYYEIYHTLDPNQAIERILETNNCDHEILDPVEVYKSIISKR